MAVSGTERRYNFDDNVRVDLPHSRTATGAGAGAGATIPCPKCDQCGAKVGGRSTENTLPFPPLSLPSILPAPLLSLVLVA